MKKAFFAIAALFLMGLSLQSCKKEKEISENEIVAAEDFTAHNDLSELVDYDVDEAIDGFVSGEIDERNSCPTVTFAQPKGVWPNTITLDYSDAGCTKNGRTFKGKIVIEQSNPMNMAGATRSFTFVNFSIEDVQIAGTRVVTNEGPTAGAALSFSIVVNETLTYPNGSVATYSSTRTRALVDGGSTPARADDVWNITGSANGVNRNGVAYTVSITNPLVKKAFCNWISEGVIELTANGLTRTLDYGDGSCDRDATLTLADGTVKEVKIRHFWWR